ncbi:STAGA complex 65 subunit gamma [Anabrus simplex]|uniref:STAGA complex 65 subunit gamma n=1 Tax=Anabrus simplex TaxID=316456 RepID=UPI0034DD8E36
MEGTRRHWGEYDPPDNGPAEVISSELAASLIQKGLKPVPLKLYQPCGYQEPTKIELPAECSAMDDTVLHTIKLLQYEKKMTALINHIQPQMRKISDMSEVQDLKPPVFPEQVEKKPLHTLKYPFGYMEIKSSPFTRGEPVSVPELNLTNTRLILRKAVAALFAHVGYDTTTQAVLDTMTDIAEDFILKFVNLLRIAVDQELTSGSTSFPDPVERVFAEMGLGSMLSLHTFYQQRVLMYHQRVLNDCLWLATRYSQLTESTVKQEVMIPSVKCKIENEDDVDDDVDVPEIHFPALGDGYAVDELQPSLEPGFQMLHSLEQEEQKVS